jgi:hypothetical protein
MLATATASASSSAEPKNKALTVLGGTLGGILGLAAILVVILLLLRWSADRAERQHLKRREQNEKENRLSFADQGASFMHEAGGRIDMNDSVTSLQILTNRAGPGHRRAQPSDSSTLGLVQHSRPAGKTDAVEMDRMGAAERSGPSDTQDNSPDAPVGRSEQSRSAGWSQYFADNNLTNLAAAPSSGPSLRSSDMSNSEYDESRRPSGMRPLDLNLGPRFGATAGAASKGGNGGNGGNGDNGDNGAAGRAISTSTYDRSHWSELSEEDPLPNQRISNGRSSTMTQFPTVGSGPVFGNAFAKDSTALSTSPPNYSSRDFPMPRVYQAPQTGQSVGLPAFPKAGETRRDVGKPQPNRTSRGPVIRKMTGSEDMSWLNINSGRPM